MTEMKHAVAVVISIAGIAPACGGAPTAPDTSPSWLSAVIAQMRDRPAANPPAVIARYVYNGQTVYFVPQRCCDIASVLYSATGSVICHPDGGFTGRGDGQCPDFFEQRKEEHIIWRDARR